MELSDKTLPGKIDILGVGVSTTSYGEIAALCHRWISERDENCGRGRYICVTSVHGVMEARKKSTIREILNHADIVAPDGMPLVWALRSCGVTEQQRVYGPSLMMDLCARAEICGHRIFLY